MRALFLATNPGSREASTRYRVDQFVPLVRKAGHEVSVSTFFSDCPERTRLARVLSGLRRRVHDVHEARDRDVVLVHREFLPQAWNFAAVALPRHVPVVFDFDDAVFLRTSGTRAFALPETTRQMVRRAALTFAGNEYLASYARRFSSNVEVLPTVVDTSVYFPRATVRPRIPVVGWIGSASTSRYLMPLMPVLDALARVHAFKLRVIGNPSPIRLQHLEVENRAWHASTEAQEFRDLDIGLYPLPEESWVHGKCGFKAIQYMASGVPCVVSPVGVTRSIVRDEIDGLWAPQMKAFRPALARLLDSEDLRRRLAASARLRSHELYSLEAIGPRFVRGLSRAANTG